jgi:hypothetical protein
VVVGVNVNEDHKLTGTKSRDNERARVHILSKTYLGCEMSDSGEVCNKVVMGL